MVAPSASLKSSLENDKVRLYYIRIARFTPPIPTGFKVGGAGGSRRRKTVKRFQVVCVYHFRHSPVCDASMNGGETSHSLPRRFLLTS